LIVLTFLPECFKMLSRKLLNYYGTYLTASVVYWSEFLATDPEARIRFPALPEKKLAGLERGQLSLVSTTEELLDRKVAAPVKKRENTAVEIRHADHVAPSIRKTLAITSPTSGGRSVGIVRSRTQSMEFSF
jgi:hypothetical protein